MLNKKSCGKVLVLGSDTRSFLTVIRSLGRKKLNVHVAWCNPSSLSLYSRYINKVHQVPNYTASSDVWLQPFVEMLKNENYDLVIPTNDPCIIPIQNNRKELEQYAQFYLLDDDTFDICINKFEVTKLAKSLNISVPNDIVTSDINEITQFAEKYSFPIVLKPASSFTMQQTGVKFEVEKAHNLKELTYLSNKMLQNGKLQIQENFIGKGVGVEVLANKGEILTSFQHERVHEPMMGGGSSYRKSMVQSKQLIDAVEKLIGELKYTGVAMIEFKVNEQNDTWVLIEINSRFWGSLPLSVASGIDFPYWLYQMLTSQKTNFPTKYKSIYCRNTALDFEWLISNLEADRHDPLLSSIPLHHVASELKNILLFKEKNDTFQLDDIKPGIMEIAQLGKRIYSPIKSKCILALKNTFAYKKYKFNKCRKALLKSQNILFLCYGNICRSPFAEIYARKVLPEDFTLSSCGIHDKIERNPPDLAISAASTFGVDLLDHRSIQITREIAEESDIIFVHDDKHYKQLIRKYPFVKEYTFMINSLNMSSSRTVEDPFGKSLDEFISTYSIISKSIDLIRNSLEYNLAGDN